MPPFGKRITQDKGIFKCDTTLTKFSAKDYLHKIYFKHLTKMELTVLMTNKLKSFNLFYYFIT